MGKQNRHRTGSNKPVWDVLLGLSQAVGQVNNVTALLIPYLQDRELLSRLSDPATFNRLASRLEADIRNLTGRYNRIYEQHRCRQGQTSNPTEWMRAIDLHEQYIAWATDFDDIAIPTFMEMMDMLRQAGASNIPSVQSASAIVRQHSP